MSFWASSTFGDERTPEPIQAGSGAPGIDVGAPCSTDATTLASPMTHTIGPAWTNVLDACDQPFGLRDVLGLWGQDGVGHGGRLGARGGTNTGGGDPSLVPPHDYSSAAPTHRSRGVGARVRGASGCATPLGAGPPNARAPPDADDDERPEVQGQPARCPPGLRPRGRGQG